MIDRANESDELNEFRRLLDCDFSTGQIMWKTTGKGRRKDKVFGRINSRGYICGKVLGKNLLAHRIVWFLYHGKWPSMSIDHIDGCKTNNAITNIRDSSVLENNMNVRVARSNNKTGYLGVCKKRKKFHAQTRVNGKKVHIGDFDTPEDAHSAYLIEKRKHHNTCSI